MLSGDAVAATSMPAISAMTATPWGMPGTARFSAKPKHSPANIKREQRTAEVRGRQAPDAQRHFADAQEQQRDQPQRRGLLDDVGHLLLTREQQVRARDSGEGYHRSASDAGEHRLRAKPLELHPRLHEHAAVHETHHAAERRRGPAASARSTSDTAV